MSNFGFYTGKQLLEMKLKKRDWIIKNLIRYKDSVILVGDAKAGKTLLKQQLICSLTSGHPFLDKYDIVNPCKVIDIQLEGELEDTQDRFKRMISTIDFNPEMYHILFDAPLELNTLQQTFKLIKKIGNQCNGKPPDLIFIDPVYFAFKGSLSDDLLVRLFLGNIRIIKETFDCTMVLVHHTHKIRINWQTGELIDEGDEAMFGSKFFRAFPDHILMLVYDKKNDLRVLTCSTQRSGEITDRTQLKLIQPEPLYFKEVDEQPTREDVILEWLRKAKEKDINGFTYEDIEQNTDLSKGTIYSSLKILVSKKLVIKSNSRPVRYSLKVEKVS